MGTARHLAISAPMNSARFGTLRPLAFGTLPPLLGTLRPLSLGRFCPLIFFSLFTVTDWTNLTRGCRGRDGGKGWGGGGSRIPLFHATG